MNALPPDPPAIEYSGHFASSPFYFQTLPAPRANGIVVQGAVELDMSGPHPTIKLLDQNIDDAAKKFWNAMARVIGQAPLFPEPTP